MVEKRKRKINKYADLSEPEAVFDFHGRGILSEQQMCSLARDFVLESAKNGYSRILLIVGKGLHSKGGPVIGPVLRVFLSTLVGVSAVRTARRDRGGEGAFEVRLHV